MIFSTDITVQFYDLDLMQVVWHGNYVKYLEKARCEMLNKIGYTYSDMAKDGISYPVATMQMKYIKPCTFNQKLKVTTEIEELEPALIINYTIIDSNTGEKMFKAKTMQICYDLNTQQSRYEAPENLKKMISCCKV